MARETTNQGYVDAQAYASDPDNVNTPDQTYQEYERGKTSYNLSKTGDVTSVLNVDPATGRVGIGVTGTPDGPLHIKTGEALAGPLVNADELVIESDGDAGITILTTNTTTGRIQFGDAEDNDAGSFAYSHLNDAFEIIIGGAERGRFSVNGLAFNGDTAAANSLNDYEEGTFTPALQGDGGASGITYTTQEGTYVKIGKSVLCRLRIVLSGKTSITGGAIITGLPFTSSSLGTQSAGIAYYNNLLVGWASIQPFISSNSTNISLSGQKTTGTSPTTLADADIGSTTQFDLSFSYEV